MSSFDRAVAFLKHATRAAAYTAAMMIAVSYLVPATEDAAFALAVVALFAAELRGGYID